MSNDIGQLTGDTLQSQLNLFLSSSIGEQVEIVLSIKMNLASMLNWGSMISSAGGQNEMKNARIERDFTERKRL
jgi:hypothetical protein